MAYEAVLNVIDRYGDRKTIPISEWDRAQTQGYQLESGDSIVEAQRAEKYDQPVAAGVEGFARGLTFGLSDLGADEAAAARRRYNPVAAGIGEIGGSVAGLGVTGVGSLAGRAAKGAFTAEGILARAGQAAVRGTIEGGAIGAGQGISEIVFSNDPLTAESIAGSLGHHIYAGALTGGIGGAGLSLTGSGLGAAIRGAGKVVNKAASSLQEELAADGLPSIPGPPIPGYGEPAIPGARAGSGVVLPEIGWANDVDAAAQAPVKIDPKRWFEMATKHLDEDHSGVRDTFASELDAAYGIKIEPGAVNFKHLPFNIYGQASWDGTVDISQDLKVHLGDMLMDLAGSRAEAAVGKKQQALSTYLHELLHRTGVLPGSYVDGGAVIEEVATEVAARRIVRDLGLRAVPKGAESYDSAIYAVVDAVRKRAKVDFKAATQMVSDAAIAMKASVEPRANDALSHIEDFVIGLQGKGVTMPVRDKIIADIADMRLNKLPAAKAKLPLSTGPAAIAPETALTQARDAELSSLQEARTVQGTALAKDIETFRYDVRADLMKLKQSLPKGAGLWAEAIAPEKQLHKVIGDLKSLAEEPTLALKPLRRLEQQVAKIGEKMPQGTVDPMLARMRELQGRIADLAGEPTSARLEAIDAHLEAIEAGPRATPKIDALTKGAGAAIGGAIGGLAGHGVPWAGVAGAWLGKEVGGTVLQPLVRKVLGAFADHAGAIQDGTANLLSKLTPPPAALSALQDLATAAGVTGESAYERATTAVARAAANPEETRENIRQELAGLAAMNPQLAEQVGQQLELRLNFLASKVPPPLTMGITGRAIPPSETEQSTFARYVAAASDPLRLLKELRAGTLMPETVETHKALYPEMSARVKTALTQQLADPAVASKLTYPMRLQLGILNGPQVDPTLDPGFVALMQSNFQQAKPLKMPGGQVTGKTAPPTAAQQLTAR